ncbi:MAG TPA: hypothetical protein EYG80_03060 [Flavobacteriaceae bacterium]|nr:hypothetical protein [Flavobacteriaceae bacterium]
MVPILLKAILVWAEKDLNYLNADIYHDKIYDIDYFTNIPIPIIIAVLIVATIFKIIHTKSSKIKYIKEEEKYDFIENAKKEILYILKLNNLYLVHSTTVLIGKKIYLSLSDLKSFINKKNANGLFIIYHESHHIKSGDTSFGYYTLILNQILSILLIYSFGYSFLLICQNIIMEWNIFLQISKGYQTLINEFLLIILLGYIFYQLFYFNKYISKFKECLADRTAHILLDKKSLLYSNDIFNGSSDIKHPKKIDRINCSKGKSNLLEKVIIYYGIIELLSIFPSFLTINSIYYIFFIHVNYLLIIFIILRLGLDMSNPKRIQYFLIFYPILLWVKFQIVILISLNLLNDVIIEMEQSIWLETIYLNINITVIMIAILTYGYLIYEKFTKNI